MGTSKKKNEGSGVYKRGGGGGRSSSSSKDRTSITVLLLGDEGVGKSTLISTFVSRHFSEVVPGIMTRVRLPPDPSLMSCITTIVDSQGADAALLSAIQQQQQQQQTSLQQSASKDKSSGSLESLGNVTPIPPPVQQAGGVSNMGSSISTSAMENVDSIILVYDLDRSETFYRLENHWLPLIERCYNGELPVVIAGNKMDLFRQPSTTTTTTTSSQTTSSTTTNPTPPTPDHQTQQTQAQRSRAQIVSLLQRFKFVRQCIKCSAKNLLNVDEVFLKAQQSVLYPISPLYDLNTGKLTLQCKKAFERIFRIYDVDNDGLLSNQELNAFQNKAFHVPLVERDLSGWKKVVRKHNPSEEERVIENGKFTVAGFLAIFDVFISQNRLEVPWRILRTFGYDDELVLDIPSSVLYPPWLPSPSMTDQGVVPREEWKLSPSATNFLTALFHQFDSNKDGILSSQDLLNIFSVVPEPSLPPWHSLRASNVFRGCFSLPKGDMGDMVPAGGSARMTTISPEATMVSTSIAASASSPTKPPSPPLSTSGITICSAASLPSVDLSATTTSTSGEAGGFQPKPKPLSFLDWMGQWHMISAISPSTTRAELYRLGHVEDRKQQQRRVVTSSGNKKKVVPTLLADYSSLLLPSKEIRTLVVGSAGCGKTSFLNYLCCNSEEESDGGVVTPLFDPLKTTSTLYPETSCSYIRMKKRTPKTDGSKNMNENKDDGDEGEEYIVHLVFTEVPANDVLSSQQQLRSNLAFMISGSSDLGSGSGVGGKKLKGSFDLIILAFDCTDPLSFTFVKEMESSLISEDVPRVFVGSKFDKVEKKMKETEQEEEGEEILPGEDSDDSSGGIHGRSTIDIANEHCAEFDLEPPLLMSSALNFISGGAAASRHSALEHLARCTFDMNDKDRLRSTPHAEQKRREAAKRRKLMWLGGILSVSVAMAIGVSVFLGGGNKKSSEQQRKDRFTWLKSLFSRGRAVTAE